MMKLYVIIISFVVLLSGCQESGNSTLNTSNLEKVEVEGNVGALVEQQ